MRLSLFMLFHRLGGAEMQQRQLKKVSFNQLSKCKENIWYNACKWKLNPWERWKKNKREDTHMMLEEIACRNMLERVFPLKFHSFIPLGLSKTESSLFQSYVGICFLKWKYNWTANADHLDAGRDNCTFGLCFTSAFLSICSCEQRVAGLYRTLERRFFGINLKLLDAPHFKN